MLFRIEINQETADVFAQALVHLQEDLARGIRVWNNVMRECSGGTVDSPGTTHDIDIFNSRQKLLRKLAEKASDDFMKKLQPDDLKLWEELPLEKRGLGELKTNEETEVDRPRYRRFTLAMKNVNR